MRHEFVEGLLAHRKLELGLLDLLGKVREGELDVADLAVGLGALDGLRLDLCGHVLVVLEGVLQVVELDLGVLALAQDLGELALDLLASRGDVLELCLLGHARKRGGVLQQREVDLLEPEERGGFAHGCSCLPYAPWGTDVPVLVDASLPGAARGHDCQERVRKGVEVLPGAPLVKGDAKRAQGVVSGDAHGREQTPKYSLSPQ